MKKKYPNDVRWINEEVLTINFSSITIEFFLYNLYISITFEEFKYSKFP